MDNIQKHYPVEFKAVDGEPDVFDIVISTETPDRDGDIIEVKGWQDADYLKNPIVLFGHDYRSVPIGKTLSLRKDPGGQYIARFQWRTSAGPLDPVLFIRSAWDQGMLNAASVGFRALEWEPITDGIDPDDMWEMLFAPRRYTKQELLEWSIVPIPANQEALRLSFIKAMKAANLPDEYRKTLEALQANTPAEEPETIPADEEGTAPPTPEAAIEEAAPEPQDDDPNNSDDIEQDEDDVLLVLGALVETIEILFPKEDLSHD